MKTEKAQEILKDYIGAHGYSKLVTADIIKKILDTLAEPDNIEKGKLKIPKGVQAEWDAEYAKAQAERDAAYWVGFQEGTEYGLDYEHGRKDGVPPPPPTGLERAADELERMSAVCPHCNLSINHPPDCPNNTDGPEEHPAFGMGDIVEIPKTGFVGQVGKVHYNEAGLCDCVSVRQTDASVLVSPADVELFFPLSRILKELKLPTGETIYCGDIFETPCGMYAMVIYINMKHTFPIGAVFWDTQNKVFRQSQYGTHEVKRVIWRMEKSK